MFVAVDVGQIDVPSAPRTGWRPASYPSDPIVGTTSRGKGLKPISPGHARDTPDTGVQGRAIAARNASFPHVAAATNGSDLAALPEQTAACGHLAARCQSQQVLINGGGGGSGIYAVQFAKQGRGR